MANKNKILLLASIIILIILGWFIINSLLPKSTPTPTTEEVQQSLSSSTSQDRTTINAAITERYGSMPDGFIIEQTNTFLDNTYTLIILTKTTEDVYNKEEGGVIAGYSLKYRLILKRNDNTWSFISDPKPLISTTDYPEVPQKYIDYINRL